MSQLRPVHGFSVDVEDWFHVLDCAGAPASGAWPSLPSRVRTNTVELLDLLARFEIRATFFVLGWVAERDPDLVAAIAERGHDVGSHGYGHQLVPALGVDGFARDLDRSLAVISRASGQAVTAYRAPGFSIGPGETWALETLASRGIEMDASLFLARRAHGGYPLDRQRPFEVKLSGGRTLLEVPVVPWRLPLGRDLAFSGGGYLRLLPTPVVEAGFAAAERRQQSVVAYIHPREIDPGQPRMALPALRRFKYYVGLEAVQARLEHLFSRFRFGSLRDVAAQGLDSPLDLAGPA